MLLINRFCRFDNPSCFIVTSFSFWLSASISLCLAKSSLSRLPAFSNSSLNNIISLSSGDTLDISLFKSDCSSDISKSIREMTSSFKVTFFSTELSIDSRTYLLLTSKLISFDLYIMLLLPQFSHETCPILIARFSELSSAFKFK